MILFDFQIFIKQKIGGISIFLYILKNNIIGSKIIAVFSKNTLITKSSKNVLKALERLKGFNRVIYFMNKLVTIYFLKFHDVKVFVPTYYDPYFLPFIKKQKIVLIIHDMTYEKFPELFNKKDFIYTTKGKYEIARKADVIVAVSENTKNDIKTFYKDIDTDKIVVIPHFNFSQEIESFGTTKPILNYEQYILYIGNRSAKYKNFEIIINALFRLHLMNIKLNLVCIGGGSFSQREKDIFSDLNLSNAIFQGDFDEDQKSLLLNHAVAMVYPSLYEGFGIPILEAFQNKCPVILSRSSCFPEVAKEAALFFDPDLIDQLLNCILSVHSNQQLRNSLIENGISRLSYYSKERFLNSYSHIFNSFKDHSIT